VTDPSELVPGEGGPGDVFAQIRAACAAVAAEAVHVGIDAAAVDRLAATLSSTEPGLLPEERPPVAERRGEDPDGEDPAAATVLAWNAVNFGSGWFPVLRKRRGLSGARTLAAAFADHVREAGAPTAAWLEDRDAASCATLFGQPHPGPVDDLLELFAVAWRDLGRLLRERSGGSASELVRQAGGSAARLVAVLGSMPLARDVATYRGHSVPFYKRAQITVSHLARALGGSGLGRFDDGDRLTAFADNLVPHVLRRGGVLVYDAGLAARIGREELLAPGGEEEVEIRACGLHAVELLARRTGIAPASIDHQLWQRGQDPAIKAVPRHRCRCSWY
jgi:hypothetical protein